MRPLNRRRTEDISNILGLLAGFADVVNANPLGRRVAGLFNGAIQFRWVLEPVTQKPMSWFGGHDGSWACLDTKDGEVTLREGDHRGDYEWRFCVLIETDEETLRAILQTSLRPLEAFLADRLHVSHFTVAGAMGQWVLALLAFGQRARFVKGLLPAKSEKTFMTYPYRAEVDERRRRLLARARGESL